MFFGEMPPNLTQRQLHRLHFEDKLPQKKVAETAGTLCSPRENQKRSQSFLLTRDETSGTGSTDD